MQISSAGSFLKSLDQQPLVDRLQRAVPVLLPLAGTATVLHDTVKAPEGERTKSFIKSASVVGFTVAGALLARRFMPAKMHPIKQAAEQVLQALRHESPQAPKRLLNSLERMKAGKVLSPWAIHNLRKDLGALGQKGEAHFQTLIPNPDKNKAVDVTMREIWQDIKGLSLLGLFPVVGGIAGGVVGNLLNRETHWRQDLKNQTKEGLFQYLANIALCNVGAMGAILALKQTPLIHSKPARLVAMAGGIATVGILFGGSIANFVGKNFLNPLFEHGPAGVAEHLRHQTSRDGLAGLFRNINAERHTEPADWGLHVDDFATMGFLSGMRWVEPMLPFLYSISGYRAGVGYRNGKDVSANTPVGATAAPRLGDDDRDNPFRHSGFGMHQVPFRPLQRRFAFIPPA